MSMNLTLSQVAAMLPSASLVGDGAVRFDRVNTDTRSLKAGDLFVALRGERFDAHDFLAQAAQAGAVAAIAEQGLTEAGLAGLQVPDSKLALGQLAAAWRARFELPFIAVTGSNGKTTVTQMIASVLQAWVGEGAFSTQGNFNNDIGVPLTLLRLRQGGETQHRAGVVELGMNHPGEIAGLAAMAAPTVALVNNAQREHQEFMESVEAVARENGSVIAALAADGVAVYPADEEFSPLWAKLAGARPQMRFALEGAAEVTGHAEWQGDHWAMQVQTPAGACALRLRIAGRHNVKNALAATACALAAGVPLQAVVQGLEQFEPVKGRSQLKLAVIGSRQVTLVDDTYNANPDSARAAIDVLAQLPGPRWLVLGDMGEVGEQGPAFHAEVGAHAATQGIEHVWTVGELCRHVSDSLSTARHFDSVPELVEALKNAPAVSSVLVKGSRFMAMERVVAALQATAEKSNEGKIHAA